MAVFFHNEDVVFSLQNKNSKKEWLKSAIHSFNYSLGNINVIFCSDDYLLNVNKQYLSHNYYTDIITFNYCTENTISGDLFISIDRVEEYSKQNNIPFLQEINRVIVHGVLHLCGFNDKTPIEKKKMRQLENKFLTLIKT